MNRIITLLVLFLILVANVMAQDGSADSCSIRTLNNATESRVNNYLNNQKGWINILLSKNCQFIDDSLFLQTQQNNEIKNRDEFCGNIFQIVDSVIIQLDNGLSWNLELGPPKKPKRFPFKMFSKKAKENKEVLDRINFLQFCGQFDLENDNPCEISETYIVFGQIIYNEQSILKATYSFDPKTKRFEILQLEDVFIK